MRLLRFLSGLLATVASASASASASSPTPPEPAKAPSSPAPSPTTSTAPTSPTPTQYSSTASSPRAARSKWPSWTSRPPSRCRPTPCKTAVLLHGKNFCGATWQGTIAALSKAGYRVIAPDQVGFCKSSKPDWYQYSLHQFAANTADLLDALGLSGGVSVIGHSLGGMLATRFGLMYPDRAAELVLANEAASTYQSIRGYEQAAYYLGSWSDAYDVWVKMLVNIYYGSQRDAFVRIQARIVDLVLTQPIAHEFSRLQPRTLLMIGEKDITAIGAQWSPPEVAAKLGKFDKLGPYVLSQLPRGTLIRFPDLGHAPQISSPTLFHEKLLGWLGK
ncbi:unnamed protein product [Parascedosporium putredinis]|uniref:AB hydrolase-1 domain-containing protein n=1 Tax=Parascedosporium putredinis TaxID=1442378 RepID=A0A9P1M9M4_9PEZI|nr:unnamed protein product [Parascedosporium putredinis]CAI7991084.1 unnamed protein product [Parascedosporium putredinis]